MLNARLEDGKDVRPGLHAPGSFRSLVDILRWRADHQGEAVAFRFLRDDEDETLSMTYAQLDEEVRRLAACLQSAGLTGERVFLLFPSEPAYLIAFLACLYAGVVAVPLNLPRPNRDVSRWTAVALNARPRAALTTSATLRARGGSLQGSLQGLGIPVIATDGLEAPRCAWDRADYEPGRIAYLQYTSGSTSHPKGVAITHRNMISNCAALAEVVGRHTPHVGAGWLPFYHDMGLVGTLLLPLFLGFPVVLMPPEAFIMKPARWLRAISRYRVTISPAPNFAYDLCTQRVSPDQRAGLDLSSWRFAFNGAERVDPRTIDQFADTFAPCGFRPEAFLPCYGLAEATLFVAGSRTRSGPIVRRFRGESLASGRAVLDDEGTPLVSCGRPYGEIEVAIVDPVTRRRSPEGHVGEIWVSGPSVAAGYWDDPAATGETFQASGSGSESGSSLRTGDLGFQLEGELFVTGRLKDLIIIGGRNICAEDVEAAAEAAHPAIAGGDAIAFAIDGSPRERLIIVAEVQRHDSRRLDREQLERAVREAVARRNDVAVDEIALVRAGAMPRTPNGKKMRSACRMAFIKGSLRGRIDREYEAT